MKAEDQKRLVEAIKNEDEATILSLLGSANENVNIKLSQVSNPKPLHIAASKSNKMVNLFLLKGADVNAKTDGGWTALHLAAVKGDIDSFKSLMQHRAGLFIKDHRGTTPFSLLKDGSEMKKEVIRYIIQSERKTNRYQKKILQFASLEDGSKEKAKIISDIIKPERKANRNKKNPQPIVMKVEEEGQLSDFSVTR